MKAKEYAQIIIDDNHSIDSITTVTKMLVDEIKTIAQARHCQTESALNSVFKEIDQKYRAMCRLVNKDVDCLKEGGFKSFMKALYKNSPTILEFDYFK